MEDIELDYAVPDGSVAEFVTLFYRFHADVACFDDVERADHAQIRFRLTPGAAEYRFVDGRAQPASDAHLIGPTTAAFHVHAEGPVLVFGAGLTPLGWAALVGGDASGMTNRVVDLHTLFGEAVADVVQQMQRVASDFDALVLCGEAIIKTLLRTRCAREAAFIRIVDTWLSGAESPEIGNLAAATGMSIRQLERKCKALYGAGPKGLARKYRALRAAVSLVAEGATIDDVLARGFYDQSHLIREVKQFTGFTPGQIQSEPGLLAQLTISRRTALAGRVDPLISDT